MLLVLATIATFAFIAWFATPIFKQDWPKGTRLLAIPALLSVTLAFAVPGQVGGPLWVRLLVFVVFAAAAARAVDARDRRVARRPAD